MEEEKQAWGGARPGAGRKAIGTKPRAIKLSPEADAYVNGMKGLSAYLSALIIADKCEDPKIQIAALADKIKSLSEKL